MKKITITRIKSFVACLAKAKVYICDGSNTCDIAIDGYNCKLYGTLKNGETKTFEVPDTATRIYVTFDKLSAGYCNDVYILAEGVEDITLTGKCSFNPAAGNPFRFDNNDNPEALANRKKGGKQGAIILTICLVAGLIAGFIVGFSGIFNKLF